jgi:hypothetical protein
VVVDSSLPEHWATESHNDWTTTTSSPQGAHLAIVFAALVVTHWIEHRTGWSIKKFVRTARRYRTIQIRAGQQILTAADPLPEDLREALAAINPSDGVH